MELGLRKWPAFNAGPTHSTSFYSLPTTASPFLKGLADDEPQKRSNISSVPSRGLNSFVCSGIMGRGSLFHCRPFFDVSTDDISGCPFAHCLVPGKLPLVLEMIKI